VAVKTLLLHEKDLRLLKHAPDLDRVRREDNLRTVRIGIVSGEELEDRLNLRRLYGSLMLNAGASIVSVQQVLGHADMRMTRRAYAHLLQDTVAEQVQKHLPSFEDVANRRRKASA
jgi:integrase